MSSASCPPRARWTHHDTVGIATSLECGLPPSLRASYPLDQVDTVRRIATRRHSIGATGAASVQIAPPDARQNYGVLLRRQVHPERIDLAAPNLPQPPRAADAAAPAPVVSAMQNSAAAAAARINAFGPASFGARLGATWRLLRGHTDYGQALGAMWLHRFGSGMLTGSFMVLISGMGTSSAVQSVLTLSLVDLLSHIIPPVVSVHGAHLRDNADATARVGARTRPGRYAKGLLYTAVGDALIAAAMWYLAYHVAYFGLAGPWLLVPLGVLRLLQSCLGFYEFNLFNAFKARLPAPELVESAQQHFTITSSGIRFVVLSIEANVGATLTSMAQAIVVFGARSMLHSARFHSATLIGIAVGGLVASLPKVIFYPHARESDA